ncbi:Terpenoid synthase [Penicillium italicum]|uniref:Terpenoid synthase n=1 Tax=Penicillium italicum TaxID=40296 RepID=A0A0A2L4B2_PENIT|nr:Terpenoid synthase [Penicillium italicum]
MVLAASPRIKAELSAIAQVFLLDIGYDLPLELNPAVEDEVKLHFKNHGFSDEFFLKIEPQIKPSVGIPITTFQTTLFDAQCTVATFITYCLIVDHSSYRHCMSDYQYR